MRQTVSQSTRTVNNMRGHRLPASQPGFELNPGQGRNNLCRMNADVNHFHLILGLLIPLIILVALWDGVWKAIGMWKSARNNQVAWFVCIAIFNTIGILPI